MRIIHLISKTNSLNIVDQMLTFLGDQWWNSEKTIKLENIDPLRYMYMTSVCMLIAVIPEYVKADNYSKVSVMWLDYSVC